MCGLNKFFALIICFMAFVLSGCVERQLTIETIPTGAYVELNDEAIGYSPVTVSFNWYGTYRIRAQKEGFETLKTSRKLDRPLGDYFPFDLFRGLIAPDTVDSYHWDFQMQELVAQNRDSLIQRAEKAQTDTEQAIDRFEENLRNEDK